MAFYSPKISFAPFYDKCGAWHSWFFGCPNDYVHLEINDCHIISSTSKNLKFKCGTVNESTIWSKLFFIMNFFHICTMRFASPRKSLFYNPFQDLNSISISGMSEMDIFYGVTSLAICIKGVTGKVQRDGTFVYKPIMKVSKAKVQHDHITK